MAFSSFRKRFYTLEDDNESFKPSLSKKHKRSEPAHGQVSQREELEKLLKNDKKDDTAAQLKCDNSSKKMNVSCNKMYCK